MSAFGRALFLFVAPVVVCVLATDSVAQDRCQSYAEGWVDTDDSITASNIAIICRGFRATADRGTFSDGEFDLLEGNVVAEGEQWRLDCETLMFLAGDEMHATAGCISLRAGEGVRVCGDQLAFSGSSWTAGEAVVALPTGGSLRAESARCDESGCEVSGARISVGLSLPYPVGAVDAAGRSRGFLPTQLGYRSDRGVVARQDWYQPLGAGVSLRFGARGATDGAIGAQGSVAWHRPISRPSAFELIAMHDSSRPDENRLSVTTDLTWSPRSASFGLAWVGTVHSDGTLARDLGETSTNRLRGDQHVSGNLWAGFGTDRLWIASHGHRALSFQGDAPVFASLADDQVSPALVFRGALPSTGYAHQATIGRAVHLNNALRFDRWVVLDSARLRSLNEARLLGGGQLRVLSFPGFSFIPGLWVDLGARFNEPDADDPFRQFSSRLLTTAELSSAWVGGGGPTWHFVELVARLRYESFRYSDTVGDSPGAELGAPLADPIAFELAVEQELRGHHFSLELPIWWSVRGEASELGQRVAHSTRLALNFDSVRMTLEQRVQLDLDPVELCCWDGGIDMSFGRRSSPFRLDLRTGVWLWQGNEVPGKGYRVSALPQMRRTVTTPIEEHLDVMATGMSFHFTPFGLDTTVAWPLGFDDSPDISGSLWLGELGGFRLTARVSYLSDETVITFLSLTQGD